jgi:RNA polymerase sigma factor (sigma-70 family)
LNFVRWYKVNKQKRTSELKPNIPLQDNSLESSTLVDADTILSVLDTMSEEKQEIVKLRFWGDLKFNEIAEKLNKNEAAIKKMFYRTLLDIKDKLK